MGSLLTIFLSTLLISQAQARDAKEIYDAAHGFIKMADQINLHEPTLYPDDKFADAQRWTLQYQRFVGDIRKSGEFRRIFLMPPKAVRFEQLEKAFVKYGAISSTLSDEIIPKVAEHRLMFTDEVEGELYAKKYNKVLATLLPESNGQIKRYQQFDCDYVTQPTNALWFSTNAMVLLDEYGTSLFGEKWTVRKKALMEKHKIKSLVEIHQILDPGLPTAPLASININAFMDKATLVSLGDCLQ